MTVQECLDKLVAASLAGKFPSINSNGVCCYRCGDGRECGIGIFIPDELYDPDMDAGMSVRVLLGEYPRLLPHIVPQGCTVSDVQAIQNVHDPLAHGGGKWSHGRFVDALLRLVPMFKGLTPTPAA